MEHKYETICVCVCVEEGGHNTLDKHTHWTVALHNDRLDMAAEK